MRTEKKHDYDKPNEEGIETCKFCPAQRRIVKTMKTYRTRKTTNWTRKASACARPHGVKSC